MLTPIQTEALQNLLYNARHALFLEPANGKTRVCIEAVKQLDLKNVLVISSSLILSNTWPAELTRWGPTPGRNWTFCSSSYAAIRDYQGPKPDLVIIDESTLFKNHRSQRYKNLIKLLNECKVPRLWILTGTPHPQSFTELWAQIYLLDGGKALGRYAQYISKYFIVKFQRAPELKPGAADLIYEAIAHLATVSETPEALLPPSSYKIRRYRNEPLEATLSFLQENACLPGEPTPETIDLYVVKNAYIKMRQLVQGIETLYPHSVRVQALKQLLHDQNINKAIIYTHFIKERTELVSQVGDNNNNNNNIYNFGGETPQEERVKILRDFESSPTGYLIVPAKLVSHGLNLQHAADNIIWYTIPESLETYLQANRRIIRPGTKTLKTIYHLVASGTIDEALYQRLKSRAQTQIDFFEFFKTLPNNNLIK